jgi:hypothetical protein
VGKTIKYLQTSNIQFLVWHELLKKSSHFTLTVVICKKEYAYSLKLKMPKNLHLQHKKCHDENKKQHFRNHRKHPYDTP